MEAMQFSHHIQAKNKATHSGACKNSEVLEGCPTGLFLTSCSTLSLSSQSCPCCCFRTANMFEVSPPKIAFKTDDWIIVAGIPPPPLLSPGARSDLERARSDGGSMLPKFRSVLRNVLGRSLEFQELHASERTPEFWERTPISLPVCSRTVIGHSRVGPADSRKTLFFFSNS
jgi:hypothetical protein